MRLPADEVNGLLTCLIEPILPTKTALLIIDMQNDFCDSEGVFAECGYNVRPVRKIIPPVRRLVTFCRNRDIPIIFTRFVFRPDLSDAGRYLKLRPFLKLGGMRDGTWGGEVVEELKPAQGDHVLTKNRYSAFYDTPLDNLLRELRVDTLLFTGQATNGCVDATIRDAFYRDYRVVLVSDCTATWDAGLKEAALKTVRYAFGEVVSSSRLISMLRRSRQGP